MFAFTAKIMDWRKRKFLVDGAIGIAALLGLDDLVALLFYRRGKQPCPPQKYAAIVSTGQYGNHVVEFSLHDELEIKGLEKGG